MSPDMTQMWTAQSEDKRTNHEVIASPNEDMLDIQKKCIYIIPLKAYFM